MAAPTFQLSESNTVSQTVTDNTPQIAYASVDSASTSGLSAANPIVQGNNAFEKWNRLKVTGVAPNSLSTFGYYFSSTAPTDSASSSATLTLNYSATAAPTFATPVSSASSVATTNSSTNTSAPGQSITAPSNTLNAYSSYMVTQLKTTGSAAGGNCIFASPELTVQYTWS